MTLREQFLELIDKAQQRGDREIILSATGSALIELQMALATRNLRPEVHTLRVVGKAETVSFRVDLAVKRLTGH